MDELHIAAGVRGKKMGWGKGQGKRGFTTSLRLRKPDLEESNGIFEVF